MDHQGTPDRKVRIPDVSGHTPLERAPAALARLGRRDDLWLKREDVHELGVFKWRGTLPVVGRYAEAGARAVVTCSTGNHGAAVAWACRRSGVAAIVFVPPAAVQRKLARLDELGADVRVAGSDLDSAKDVAAAFARSEGLPFFEDGAEPLQYEAYAAIGHEILEQAPGVSLVVIPVGNGALAGGTGAAIGERAPAVMRVGVVARAMPVMADSYEAGRPVTAPPGQTIADGLAVRVAIPLAVERLRTAVDVMLRVSEREIAEALVACHDAGVQVEPSAAATLAALRQGGERLDEGTAVLVISGRNLDPALLERARARPWSFPD